ncbi:MAG: hypothetical protein E4H13_13990 [Calditrichales bacterium]|nr:MAG: hypothetical protein E4H13_13990 [Calditrichales bacterium]
MTEIFERLSFQINAFQEGFEILSESKTHEEFAKNFCHILRGSLSVSFVNLYFRSGGEDSFTAVFEQNASAKPDLSPYSDTTSFRMDMLVSECCMLAIIPHKNGDTSVVLIGSKIDGSMVTDHDKISIQIFVQLLDNAYQSLCMQRAEKKLLFSLNHRLLQMNNLIDTGIELSGNSDKDSLLHLALERAVGLTNASGGRLVVKYGKAAPEIITFPQEFKPARKKRGDDRVRSIEIVFNFQNKKHRFQLFDKESRRGITDFDETDQLLIEAVARQARAGIENKFLQYQALEMEKVKKELSIAATIQQKILPDVLPQIPGYQLAGKNLPAIEVCGDYYDCIALGDDKYALIMADVSGKGIPAALLVSSLQAALRVYLETDVSLQDLAEKLNKLIYRSTTPEKYLTMTMCVLDAATGHVEALNAGHNPPLIRKKDGTLTTVKPGGIPIGMADLGLTWRTESFKLDRGDSLLFFTDGITEAMNLVESMYEDERLESIYQGNGHQSPEVFLDLLIRDVQKFVGSAEQSDDITIMCLLRDE